MASGFATRLKKVGIGLLVTFLVLCTLEGLCSFGLLVKGLLTTSSRPLAERSHTRYDGELGWVNVPGTSVADMYGPGIGLHINAQGFRGSRDVPSVCPPGRVRVVCSGDSFTLGYGVADNDTWVSLLGEQDPRIETVNMGQGGYGVDQAYLWYRREREKFAHQAHLLAIIATDFDRMRGKDFHGYGKPRLALVNGKLQVEGTPVPQRGFYVPWLTQNAALFEEVKLFRVVGGLARRIAPARGSDEYDDQQMRSVAAAMLEELGDLHRRQGTTLVLTYLPVQRDLESRKKLPWREFLHEQAARLSVPLVDMTDELSKLPAGEIDALIIQEDLLGYPQASGHYTKRGNEVVANRLYRRLMETPVFAALVEKASSSASPATTSAPATNPGNRKSDDR